MCFIGNILLSHQKLGTLPENEEAQKFSLSKNGSALEFSMSVLIFEPKFGCFLTINLKIP
jgi:hypothetical protein